MVSFNISSRSFAIFAQIVDEGQRKSLLLSPRRASTGGRHVERRQLMQTAHEIQIVPWRLINLEAHPDIKADVIGIFFTASQRAEFTSEEDRRNFYKLWLGDYLANDPDLAWVAFTPDHRAVGYIVASERDPATSPRFSALGYFQAISDLTARIPAHLHINLDGEWRSRGIGGRLVDVLCEELKERGHRAVHVVTAADSRNVGFYCQNSFAPLATIPWRQHRLLFLARELPDGSACD